MLKIIAQTAAAMVTARGKCFRLSPPKATPKIVPFVTGLSIFYRIYALLRSGVAP